MNMRLKQGRVVLVGAGPGDPDLLTVKAHRLIQQADVVFYDHLSGKDVLALCRPDATLIDVGKMPGGRVKQEDINRALVEAAQSNALIVRLKGGDPFVFGRGGEEAIYLRDAGIEVEIVPGISSALAGPALAGIPVTHRGVSTHVSIVTGFSAAETEGLTQTWHHLAAAGGTLVILMGMSRVDEITATLLGAGMSSSTPVAAVHAASTPNQRVVTGRLDTLPQLIAEHGFVNHTLLVIGDVVSLREDISEDFLSTLSALAG
jgi:uroporphyrin-III C-methyltransferase